MRRFRFFGVVLLLPALALPFFAAGCGGKGNEGKRASRRPPKDDDDDDDVKKGDKKDGSDGAGDGDKTALATTGWGTLQGQVTLDSNVPAGASFDDKMKNNKDKVVCLMGPKSDQTWLLSKDGKKRVQNVVVWLDPGPGKYFKVDPSKKTWKDEVFIDQPHCAFEPRVQAVFPKYFDGKAWVKGQTFVIKNNAPIAHNTSWKGGDKTNPGGNPLIAPKTQTTLNLEPDTKTVVNLSCTIHDWMRGKVWALDNPYFAVTDENGKFEIKNVPAGAEVTMIAWHEANGFVKTLANGGKVKIEDGKGWVFNFTLTP